MSSFPLSITQKADPKLARNTANFVPNFWGDCFLTYIPDDTVNTWSSKKKKFFVVLDVYVVYIIFGPGNTCLQRKRT